MTDRDGVRSDAENGGARKPRRRPRPLGRWAGRLGRAVAVLLGFIALAAAVALFLFTQTAHGRGLVASTIERALSGALQGDVRVGPITGGNLLTRAVLERFEIDGPDGRPFAHLESVHLEYDPIAFLRGHYVFRRLEAARATIRLRQHEDGQWNFERIFPEEDAEAEPSDLRLVIHDARLATGTLEVRRPFAVELEGAAREAAVGEALRGETIWRVEPGDGGPEQVFAVDSLRGRFPLLRLVDPGDPMRIEMERVAGTALAVRQPLPVRRFTGSVAFADSIRLRIADLRLPASRLAGAGWIAPGEPPAYRFELDAEPAGFQDLQWLPLPVPEEGGGPMRLVFGSRGEVPRLEVRDAEVRVRDSELRGGFALLLDEPARLEAVDLRLDPLRLELVDRLLGLPEGVPDGRLEGRVVGSGPPTAFRLDADLRLRPSAPGAAPSALRARGTLRTEEPYAARDLRLTLEGFDVAWLDGWTDAPLPEGRVDGSLAADGPAEGRLTVNGELALAAPGGGVSRVLGGGSFGTEEPYPLDVRLRADPLLLSAVRPALPDVPLDGAVRGEVTARGSLAELRASGDLGTARGRLRLEGRFDLLADPVRYDAEVVAREVDLRQWSPEWPESELAVRGRVQGSGTAPEVMRARFDLEILPSRVHEARVDTSVLRFSVAEGLATVDTFAIRTDVGRARGRGSFGLVEGAGGALVVDVEAPDLSVFNRWLVEGRTAAGQVEVTEDLFADFPGAAAPGAAADARAEALPDTLAGALVARGAVFGNLGDYSLGGRVEARDVTYGAWGADSLRGTLDAAGAATADSFVVNARASGVALPTRGLDFLALRVERTGPGAADVRLQAVQEPDLRLSAEAGVGWAGERRSAEVRAFRMRVGTQELALSDSALIAFGGPDGLVIRGLSLAGPESGRLRLDGALPPEGAVSLALEARDLRIGELLRVLPEPPDARGLLDATLQVRGTAAAPRMEGSVRVERPGIGTVTYALLEGDLVYLDRAVSGEVALHGERAVLARADGRVGIDLSFGEVERRLAEDAFDVRVVADSLPLKVLELGLESLQELGGTARGEVTIRGGLGNVRVEGDAGVSGVTALLPDLGVRLVRGEGRARFRGAEARIDSFVVASASGGSVLAAGTLDLSDPTDPGFDLDLRARRFVPIQRRAMRFQVGGTAHLAGRYRRPELTGRFRVSNGEFRQDELLRRQQVVDLTDPDIYAVIDTAGVGERRLLEGIQNPFMQNLQARLGLDLGPDLWLRSEEVNVEIAGDDLELRMDRADQSMAVVGTVRLVRGSYHFTFGPYTQQLRIVDGTIEFVGIPGLNPNLRIVAEYRTRTPEGPIEIRTIIRGTLSQTELALESDPPLSESDQLCFLAVGSPCLAAVDRRFGERIARESALGILGTQITAALAADLGLDYLTLRTAETGVGAEGDTNGFFAGAFAGTEIELGKYVGNDIFLSVTQPLAGSQLPGWSVVWRFTDDWTLEARAENRFARRFGQVVGSTLELEQTYGLFLFREWSF